MDSPDANSEKGQTPSRQPVVPDAPPFVVPDSPPDFVPQTPGPLTVWEVLRQSWNFVNEHEIITRASAIAFSCMMAAVPFLALVVTVVVHLLPNLNPGRTGGIGALSVTEMEQALQSMFPPGAYGVIADQIARLQAQPPIATISISLAITIWCASSAFRAIIDALNRIYGVKEARPYWRVWLISVWMTLVQTAILTGALLVIIGWPHVANWVGIDAGAWFFGTGIRWLVVVGVVMLSFALCFHIGPDVPQRHRWVTPGSIFGTLCFLCMCYGVRFYVLNFAHYDKAYGSLGGVMTLLLWFYLTSLVLLLSAEINRMVDFTAKRYAQCKRR